MPPIAAACLALCYFWPRLVSIEEMGCCPSVPISNVEIPSFPLAQDGTTEWTCDVFSLLFCARLLPSRLR